MSLESPVNYVNDLNSSNPTIDDPRSEGDDHLRNIKTALKATFPGMAGRYARVQSKSSNYTAVLNDNTSTFIATAALTLTLTAAATLGSGWTSLAYANGGDITVDPNASELINGSATATIKDGSAALLVGDGAAFYAFALPKLTSTGGASFGGALSVAGHVTLEGVTSTGATGTGDIVFSVSPTFTGTLNCAALTASGQINRGSVATAIGQIVAGSTGAIQFLAEDTDQADASYPYVYLQATVGTGIIGVAKRNGTGITGAVDVLTFSSIGLAVTGTLSASGDVSFTNDSTNCNLNLAATDGATAGLRFNSHAGTRHWNIFETTGVGGSQGSLGIYDEVAGAQRIALDTSGNLLVGTTSVGARIRSYITATGGRTLQLTKGETTDYFIVADINAGTNKFLVAGTGNVQNENNSYGSTSSRTIKTNIELAGSQWDDVKWLGQNICKFNLKSNPKGPKQIGGIAEDIQARCPGLVTDDKVPGIHYSVWYMKGMKALGEVLEWADETKTRLGRIEAALAAHNITVN